MSKAILSATLALLLVASCNTQPDTAVDKSNSPQTENGAGTTQNVKLSKGAEQAIRDLQSDTDNPQEIAGTKRLRIVSYNCENLYDTNDDPKTNDDDFTPNGAKKWTKAKYKDKLVNVTKALRAAGNGTMPAIVGLMEIENKTVLNDLRDQDIMKGLNYRYVHKDSPDARGIDVALFYQTDKMKLVSEKWYAVKTTQKGGKSRDILYAKLQLKNGAMLHAFVNHWPSKREGEEESEPKRIAAAKVLRRVTDSLSKAEGNKANIVIMGDFNSTIDQTAMAKTLGVKRQSDAKSGLVNMMERYHGNDNIGTHKYGKAWDVIDHLIVSGNMNNQKAEVFTTPYSAHICHELFLLNQSDKGYYSPKRGFLGDTWTSGYSDHLPISLDIYVKE